MSNSDLTMFDLPINTPKEDLKTVEQLEKLFIQQADLIANYDLTQSSKLRVFLTHVHKEFQKNDDLPYVLTTAARALYFKSLEHVNDLYLEDAKAKNSGRKVQKLDHISSKALQDIKL